MTAPGGIDGRAGRRLRPPTPGWAWLGAHRAGAHRALVTAAALACVVVAVARGDDASVGGGGVFPAFFVASGAVGAGAVGIEILTSATTASRRRRRRRGDHAGPPPWRSRWSIALVIAVPAAIGLAVGTATGDLDDAVAATGVWVIATVLGVPCGMLVALIGVLAAMVIMGVIAFGRALVTGHVDGRPVARGPLVGPFVAVASLLALPVVFAGPVAYDSPRRRDLAPLLGFVRDDVEVSHPVLLSVAQVATWTVVGGLAAGYAIHRIVGRLTLTAGGSAAAPDD